MMKNFEEKTVRDYVKELMDNMNFTPNQIKVFEIFETNLDCDVYTHINILDNKVPNVKASWIELQHFIYSMNTNNEYIKFKMAFYTCLENEFKKDFESLRDVMNKSIEELSKIYCN